MTRPVASTATPIGPLNRAAVPAPDGGARWLVSRGWVERDTAGHPVRGLGVLIDLTQQRRTELALAESEARLRLALRAGQIGGFDWDVIAPVRKDQIEGCDFKRYENGFIDEEVYSLV